jgi:hypothetical protein
MEVSAVRQQILHAIDRAKRTAAERRVANDEAAREYNVFLDQLAVPLFRQAAGILRAEGYLFNLFTPGGSVRLMSERSSEDFIELVLDTTGAKPSITGRSSRTWGHRAVLLEESLNPSAPIRDLTEDDVLKFLLKALEPFVEK